MVGGNGRYRGIITARQLETTLAEPAPDTTVGDLTEQPPTLAADQSLRQAVRLLLRAESAGLPVLDDDERTVVGWLSHRSLLQTYDAHTAGSRAGQRARCPSSSASGRGLS